MTQAMTDRGETFQEAVAWTETAAAVVDSFLVTDVIHPASASGLAAEAAKVVTGQSTISRDNPKRFVLKWSARERIFRDRLGSKELLAAALSRIDLSHRDGLHDLLSALVAERLSIDSLQPRELRIVVRLKPFLPQEFATLYAKAKRLLERHDLILSFRRHVGENFAGRHRELEAIARFIAPDFTRETVALASFLMLIGIGGIGKSSLLLHAVLQRLTADGEPLFPMVYIDFDRSGLMGGTGIAVLIEIVQQLGLWYVDDAGWFEKARHSLDNLLRAESLDRRLAGDGTDKDDAGGTQSGRYTSQATKIVARAFRDAKKADLPFILMLDTFEEVQFKEPELVDVLVAIADELAASIPGLRVVVATRAQFDIEPKHGSRHATVMQVGQLSMGEAIDYLRGCGMPSELTKMAINTWGRHTLTLFLLADLFRRNPLAIVDADLEPHSSGHGEIFTNLQQLILFDRIVAHIHDTEVRSIARPIFLPRFIDRQILDEVIAHFKDDGRIHPSLDDLYLTNEDDRHPSQTVLAVFDKLAREIAVGELHGDRMTLRPSLRQNIVPIIRGSDPERARMLDLALVSYFVERGALASDQASLLEARAEEIYHLLCLGRQIGDIEQRMVDGIRPHLTAMIGDPAILPGDATLTLTILLGKRPERHQLLAASEGIRQRAVTHAAEYEMARARPGKAVALIREFGLEAIEAGELQLARALAESGRWREAVSVFADADVKAEASGDVTRHLAVRSQFAQSLFNAGDATAAADAARSAAIMAKSLDRPRAVLEARTLELAARRISAGREDSEALHALSREVFFVNFSGVSPERGSPRTLRRLALMAANSDAGIALLVLQRFPWSTYRVTSVERNWLLSRPSIRKNKLVEGLVADGGMSRASRWIVSSFDAGFDHTLASDFLSVFGVRQPEWITATTEVMRSIFGGRTNQFVHFLTRHSPELRERVARIKSRVESRRLIEEIDAEGQLRTFVARAAEASSNFPQEVSEIGLKRLTELAHAIANWDEASRLGNRLHASSSL